MEMMTEQVNARGGQIISAPRYRKAVAAIDWLCAAFGFERKMVVPWSWEGGTVAHAKLTLGNGTIMAGDIETEYGRLVAAPSKASRSRKASMRCSRMSMPIAHAPRPLVLES
jgi:uncharacterized glyoxalase superfamily protein PhnB